MNFYTATANSWQNLFENDKLKDVLIDSLSWLVKNNKAKIYAFVIMPNHVHIVWSSLQMDYDLGASFKSFTGSLIRKYLIINNPNELNNYISTQNDREYHFWKRRSRKIEIFNRAMAVQKINYIHKNPLQDKWKLVELEENYKYSSAAFYLKNNKEFNFLTRFDDWI